MNKQQGTTTEEANKQDEYCISIYLLVIGYVELKKMEDNEKMTSLPLQCHNGRIRKCNGSYLRIMDAKTQTGCFVFFFFLLFHITLFHF